MMQIIAHAGSHVGGLVGKNSGEIAYSYNAGIITDAGSYVGGLVGTNEATARLSHCYNDGDRRTENIVWQSGRAK